jgi:hypothetical protein
MHHNSRAGVVAADERPVDSRYSGSSSSDSGNPNVARKHVFHAAQLSPANAAPNTCGSDIASTTLTLTLLVFGMAVTFVLRYHAMKLTHEVARDVLAKKGLLDTRAGTEALLSSIALDAGLGLIDAEETARALGEATGKDVSAAVADAVGRFGRAEVLAQSLAVAPDDATVLATCTAIVRELLDGDAPAAYGAPLKAALRVLGGAHSAVARAGARRRTRHLDRRRRLNRGRPRTSLRPSQKGGS